MGNWANVRLAVIGSHSEVVRFSKSVPVDRASTVFTVSMLVGEDGHLFAERMTRLGRLSRKVYKFQLKNDDGSDHFRRVSRNHQALTFILVFSDPNGVECGSYLIRRGRSRRYLLPGKQWGNLEDKHGYSGSGEDEDEWAYWEASFEAMDVCQAKWEKLLLNAR